MDRVQPHFSLFNRYDKDQRPNFFNVVRRRTIPRDCRFLDIWVIKMTLCSEIFNFE